MGKKKILKELRKKIEKLDIWKETIKMEKEKNLLIGMTVFPQQYEVLQDKINEIIDHLNSK